MAKKPTKELTVHLRDLGQGGNRVGNGYRVLAELVYIRVVNAGDGNNTNYVVVPLKSNKIFAYNGDFLIRHVEKTTDEHGKVILDLMSNEFIGTALSCYKLVVSKKGDNMEHLWTFCVFMPPEDCTIGEAFLYSQNRIKILGEANDHLEVFKSKHGGVFSTSFSDETDQVEFYSFSDEKKRVGFGEPMGGEDGK